MNSPPSGILGAIYRLPPAPVRTWFALRMLPEEFRRGLVVVAGAVVVAFANSGVQRLSFLIDVVGEAARSPAGRARVP